MKYDFDTPIDRKDTYSLKWDIAERELPMWVADMDFQTVPEVIEAVKKRAEHGVFGYSVVPEEWKECIVSWWQNRHDFKMEKEWILFCTGIIPAISSIVRKVTTVAENVVVMTPVYNIFFNCIYNNGRNVLESPLHYENGRYEIDFEDLEKKLSEPQTSLLILCNPQNPAGNIWKKEELERIGELCKKYHVTVLADEIHCDLTKPGREYIPFASVSEICRENSITCIAPSKTFNLAGMQCSAIVVPNDALRHKVDRGINTDEVAEPNAFAMAASIAAYTHGAEWLDELREYIQGNKELLTEFVEKELPQLHVVESDATYLAWVDVSKVSGEEDFAKYLRAKTGLYLNSGEEYRGNGAGFVRINLACPRAYVKEGLERLKQGVIAYES